MKKSLFLLFAAVLVSCNGLKSIKSVVANVSPYEQYVESLKKAEAGPSEKMPVKTLLQKDTYVTVIGQSDDWYRITLPDNSQSYLWKRQLAPLKGGVKTKLDSTQVLLSAVHTDAVPITCLEKDTAVEILARFEDYNSIITENGHAGWLYN